MLCMNIFYYNTKNIKLEDGCKSSSKCTRGFDEHDFCGGRRAEVKLQWVKQISWKKQHEGRKGRLTQVAQKARERLVAAIGWGTQSQSPLVPPTPLVMPGSQILPKHRGSASETPTRGPSFLSQATLGHPFISLVNILLFSHGFRLSGSKQSLEAPPGICRPQSLLEAMGGRTSYPPGVGEEKREIACTGALRGLYLRHVLLGFGAASCFLRPTSWIYFDCSACTAPIPAFADLPFLPSLFL